MKLRPLYDRLIVQRMKNPEQTVGGIHLPSSAQTQVNKALVLAVGPGMDGKEIPVKPGEEVLFSGIETEVSIDGVVFTILRAKDLQAVFGREG